MTDLHKPFDESLLSAYLDGELSAEARAQVEQAMQAEPALQEQLESLQRLQRELEPWRTEKLSHSIQARVMQRLGDAHGVPHASPVAPHHSNVHSRRRRTAWIGAVAASTAVAVIGWFMTLPNNRLADSQRISDARHAPPPSVASPTPLAPQESPQSPETTADQRVASESQELANLTDEAPPGAGGGGASLQFKLDRSELTPDHAVLPPPEPASAHVEPAEDFLSWAFLRALPPDSLQPLVEPAQTVPKEQWSPEWQQLIANHKIQTVIAVRTERTWDLASIQALYPQAKLELLVDGHEPQPTPSPADSPRPLVEQSNAPSHRLSSRVAVILDQRHPHYKSLVAQLSGMASPHDTHLLEAIAPTREKASAAQESPPAASEYPSRNGKVEAAHPADATSPANSKVLLILEMPHAADEPH